MPEVEQTPSELETLISAMLPEALMDAIFSSTPSGALVASAPEGKILRVSDFAARLHERPESDLVGHTLADNFGPTPVFDPSGRPLRATETPLGRALRGETVTGFELEVETPDGERVPLVSNAAPIRNRRGDLVGAISSITDLRPQKAFERNLREALAQRDEALAQREALYRELTHRVKNHLQIMTALVTLDARNPALSTEGLAEQMKGQLGALAAVYRGMDQAEVGARIEARTFLEQVCQPYATEAVEVEVEVAPPDLTLPSDLAGPVGMLVNEAVCNSHKHAFPERHGHIHVSLSRPEPGRLRVEVADDGVGWGAAGPSEASHGLVLMRMFAKQLQGELELSVRRFGGALVAAEMPEAVQ